MPARRHPASTTMNARRKAPSSSSKGTTSASSTWAPAAVSKDPKRAMAALTSSATVMPAIDGARATRSPARPMRGMSPVATLGTSGRADRDRRARERAKPCRCVGRCGPAVPRCDPCAGSAGGPEAPVRPPESDAVVGRRPNTPQKCDGMRIDPDKSVPTSNGERRAATAAAAPPLEPPVVRRVIVGVRAASELLADRLQRVRHVRLAEEDRPGRLQALGDHAVRGRACSSLARVPTDAPMPGRLDHVLQRERYAVQRAPALATRERRVGLLAPELARARRRAARWR